MRKFLILCFVFGIFFTAFGSVNAAQRRRTRRPTTTNTFRFTDDMINRVNKRCPNVLQNAQKKNENLVAFCSVRSVEVGEADLGPWLKMVHRFEKVFKQFRSLIYVAAVFYLIWIIVKAAYEGEMKWMSISMLILGVVALAFAEVLLDLATRRVTLEDVIGDGVYVDCRETQSNEAYYRCSTDDKNAALYDERYFLQITGEVKTPKSYKGIF